MTHTPQRAHIATALQKRIDKIPAVDEYGVMRIKDFGVFIDTHRDQPHVGSFADDIHRGQCNPTMVDYLIGDDMLRHQETGGLLQRHDKHLFITPDAWSEFLVNWLITNGTDPRAGDGTLPTSHFRDPRKGIYLLKSFRQMVDWHAKP
jgi:hypothetical protein